MLKKRKKAFFHFFLITLVSSLEQLSLSFLQYIRTCLRGIAHLFFFLPVSFVIPCLSLFSIFLPTLSPLLVSYIYSGQSCRIWYEVGGRRDLLAAGDLVICAFYLRSEGHDLVGSPIALTKNGMLQCKFSRENKIISAEMVYDVMGFMQQYQV
jgi:hypothetical protein